jgi:hypothetical protein
MARRTQRVVSDALWDRIKPHLLVRPTVGR